MIKVLVAVFLFLCPTIVLAQCGGSYGPPISYGYYDGPPLRGPTITFYMGDIREETRVYKQIGYQDGAHRVPVINGIVPVIQRSRNNLDIVYRYDIGVSLSNLPTKSELVGKPSLQADIPHGQTDVPSPDVNPQKSEPQPPSGTKNPDDVQDPNKRIPPSYDDKTT